MLGVLLLKSNIVNLQFLGVVMTVCKCLLSVTVLTVCHVWTVFNSLKGEWFVLYQLFFMRMMEREFSQLPIFDWRHIWTSPYQSTTFTTSLADQASGTLLISFRPWDLSLARSDHILWFLRIKLVHNIDIFQLLLPLFMFVFEVKIHISSSKPNINLIQRLGYCSSAPHKDGNCWWGWVW